jgi:WD40 repeat protein
MCSTGWVRIVAASLIVVLTLVIVELILRYWLGSAPVTCAGSKQDIPLQLSPDGHVLATTVGIQGLPNHGTSLSDSAYLVGPVRLWDTSTGQERAATYRNEQLVLPRGFSPDSRVIACEAKYGPLELWRLEDGRLLGRLPDAATGLCFSPDGQALAFSAKDQAVEVWDAIEPRLRRRLRGARGPIAFSPDCHTIATDSQNHEIDLWDTTTGQKRVTLRGHTGRIAALRFSPDGRFLVSGEGPSQWWPHANRSIKPPPARVIIWDVETRTQHCALEWTHVGVPAFTANNKRVVIGGGSGDQAVLWDIGEREDPKVVDTWLGEHGVLSPDGERLAIMELTKSSCTVRVVETDQLRTLGSVHFEEALNPSACDPELRFSADSKRLVVTALYRTDPTDWPDWLNGLLRRSNRPESMHAIRVLNADDGTLAASAHIPGRVVKCSQDGRLAASVDEAGLLTIWDIPPRKPSRLAIAAVILLPLSTSWAASAFFRHWRQRRSRATLQPS